MDKGWRPEDDIKDRLLMLTIMTDLFEDWQRRKKKKRKKEKKRFKDTLEVIAKLKAKGEVAKPAGPVIVYKSRPK